MGLNRDPVFYTAGYSGKDPSRAPFYLRSLVFDGLEGDLNARLISEFNNRIRKSEAFRECRLSPADRPGKAGKVFPSRIVVVNASHDNLPTSYETARVFRDRLAEKGLGVTVKVVNTKEELRKETAADTEKVLVISQCVDKRVYNIQTAHRLEAGGVVTVPGAVTAPGGVFSDKDSTYRLLSREGRNWETVARYRKVPVEGRSVEDVVGGILDSAGELRRELEEDTVFVKPHEGGGGLGGFRLTMTDGGYVIPDLSKVSGDNSSIHPTFIDIDHSSRAKLRELLWIYRLFSTDPVMSKNYLRIKLPLFDAGEEKAIEALRNYLRHSRRKRKNRMLAMAMSRKEAEEKLIGAIKAFEKKFERRYVPLVNEHLDFGLWGLRAHYRLSSSGPVLEAMYHRIFQLGFFEEGPGYLGSDNISNKQTGELEILRLGPINEIMLESIGGRKGLFSALEKGAEALADLAELVPRKEKGKIPLRLQLDLAAVSRKIGEGNADTARGICLASRWEVFEENARQWLDDSLAYYAWKKRSS
ncbi:MAG: hypothetical protein GF408_05965 [Candidatus Omnitrophica bacterium]|nr:hypothetical protein [Candidatus Omnitrophota bacterium]